MKKPFLGTTWCQFVRAFRHEFRLGALWRSLCFSGASGCVLVFLLQKMEAVKSDPLLLVLGVVLPIATTIVLRGIGWITVSFVCEARREWKRYATIARWRKTRANR